MNDSLPENILISQLFNLFNIFNNSFFEILAHRIYHIVSDLNGFERQERANSWNEFCTLGAKVGNHHNK